VEPRANGLEVLPLTATVLQKSLTRLPRSLTSLHKSLQSHRSPKRGQTRKMDTVKMLRSAVDQGSTFTSFYKMDRSNGISLDLSYLMPTSSPFGSIYLISTSLYPHVPAIVVSDQHPIRQKRSWSRHVRPNGSSNSLERRGRNHLIRIVEMR
jgi:hypothetical protein